MVAPSHDPKAGEKTYYAQLGPEGIEHARNKPFSDADCGKYLLNLGALLLMLEPAPKKILDFGCGTGWTSCFLAKAGYEVLGVDISEDAIAVAKDVAKAGGLGRASFVAADYEGFSASQEFDYVLFYDALHHAEDEREALAAAYRALRPGGVLFAFEPGVGHSQSAGAKHAVDAFGVHEKDMPPRYVWSVGKQVGFKRKLFLPLPHEGGRCLYRRNYLRTAGAWSLWIEKIWGYFRALTKIGRVGRSGLIVMWK